MTKERKEKPYLQVETDDSLWETVGRGRAGFPLGAYRDDLMHTDVTYIDWHWHSEIELLLVERGALQCRIQSESFRLDRGQGLFVNGGVLHRYEAIGGAILPNIVFSPELIADRRTLIYQKYILPVITGGAPYVRLDPQMSWQAEVLALLSDICRTARLPDGELETLSHLALLWNILFEHLAQQPAAVSAPQSRVHERTARLQIMMQYIHDHYREHLTLDEIAAAGSVSKSTARALFAAGLQTQPVAYLIHYRLLMAAHLLETTEQPVARIAEETGFSDSAYFCRRFRSAYQMSPGAYRLQKAQTQ